MSGLELEGVNSYYGQSHVLHDVDLRVQPGEVVFLLGRNGAGKTTTMLSAANLITPRSGRVLLHGEPVAKLAPHRVVAKGLAIVPEDRRLFASMTVEENLAVAAHHARATAVPWDLARVFRVLPVVESMMRRKASTLSGGEQQMIAIARALMSNPTILLLDEPMEGLAPLIVDAIERQIVALADEGVGLLVSESHLERVTRIEARCYVMDRGRIVFQGHSTELTENRDDVERFLAV